VEGVRAKAGERKVKRRGKTAASIRLHNDTVLAAAQDPSGAHGAGAGAGLAAPGAAVPGSQKKPTPGSALRAMLKAPTSSSSRLAARAKAAAKRRRGEDRSWHDAARDLSANQW